MTLYPEPRFVAHAFYIEAVRHLHDARILHDQDRVPASMTSSMKAAELALKCCATLENAMGWWEKLQITHKPLRDMTNDAVLKHFHDALNTKSPRLVDEIKTMEGLSPQRAGGGRYIESEEANPEYPYFYLDLPAGTPRLTISSPESKFTAQDSLRFYKTARELITLMPSLYPQETFPPITLPPPV